MLFRMVLCPDIAETDPCPAFDEIEQTLVGDMLEDIKGYTIYYISKLGYKLCTPKYTWEIN